ncbi:MAG TPA: PhoH family protein [Oscillospiraceae bacterium]|nr:PhoH family protein [Oscillospiraceae bacterium]HPK36625.1 PhoH family protein [Oscillospiraceae bacterium]HPR76839.1 PhoH family protein [Oscillospiraceae bacterium]
MDHYEGVSTLCGEMDRNLQAVQSGFGVVIINRGGELKISGEQKAVDHAFDVFSALSKMISKGQAVTDQTVDYCISTTAAGKADQLTELSDDKTIIITPRGKPVRPKTAGQKKYIELIKNNTIVLSVGPAGTGKTYLAVAMAVAAFAKNEVSRIVLTRPAVEAGEKLGFLPGDLQQKIDPYLRPLYDALYDMLGMESCAKYIERGSIEIAPLAYMRGRTLDDSFIILDEAQNTTREQMKMFLTRLGFNSKAIITGDITQIDLPNRKSSGLLQAVRLLRNIDGIASARFDESDVVRHRIVKEIIKAYQNEEKQ